MMHWSLVGLLAGLMLPLAAASEARAEGFARPERWIDEFAFNGGWRVTRHPRLMGDVDGDGKADIVGFGEQGVMVSLSTGSRFREPERWVDNYSYSNGWRVDKHPRFLADVDDDGKLDIVGFGNNGVFVSLSTGSRFRPPKLWATGYTINSGWQVDRHPRFVADVNGDDRLDIVGFGDEGVFVSKSTGSKFGAPKLWVDDYGYDQGWRVAQHPRYVARVDGDDRADIIAFGDEGVFVSRAVGDRFSRPKLWVKDYGVNEGWRADRYVRLVADISGDGRSDIVGFAQDGTLVSLARADRYTDAKRVLAEFGYAQGWRVDRHPRLLGDIDGDDMADIVGFGKTGVTIATSKGGSFAKPTRALDDFGDDQGWRVGVHVRTLADVNGDGMLDIVGFGDRGTVVALAEE